MRQVEQGVAAARALFRRARSRVGGVDPRSVKPARLSLRLDDTDLPGTLGDGPQLGVSGWRKAIVDAVAWLGPVELTILAHHAGDHPLLAELVRFSYRLECRVCVVTDGSGIDADRALELVDCGLAAVRVQVGGLSDGSQALAVGNTALEATAAVQALVAARRAREVDLDIQVDIPWLGNAPDELKAIVGWARQAGVDGVRIVAPWRSGELPADPEALDGFAKHAGSLNRTPSGTIDELHAMVAHPDGQPGLARARSPRRRRRSKCPVAGQRVVLTAKSLVYACPFKAPIGELDGDLQTTWSYGTAHLQAIADCDRACAHPELAPRPVLVG